MDMRTISLFAAVLAALALAGCGDSEDDAAGGAGTSVPQTSGLGAGPGISIEEAIAADTDELLLVNGNLLADGDEVRLCYALAESFPPQCGGPSLVVEGSSSKRSTGSSPRATSLDRPPDSAPRHRRGRDAHGQRECPDVTTEHRRAGTRFAALRRRFKDFAEAMAFVNRLAEVSEAADHHPDITISWNAVTVRWWTHVKRAITDADVEMARRTDELASSSSQHS